MTTLLDKYSRQAQERRAATTPRSASDSKWVPLASIDGSKGGKLEILDCPANGNFPASIMISVKSVKGKIGCIGVDAAFLAELAVLDFSALAELCEQRARLSQAPAAAQVVAQASDNPFAPAQAAVNPFAAAPVFEAPAKVWNANLGVAKRIEWLIALAPDYREFIEGLAQTKVATDEALMTLIDMGRVINSNGSPRPV